VGHSQVEAKSEHREVLRYAMRLEGKSGCNSEISVSCAPECPK
jgi:hypothetical protein